MSVLHLNVTVSKKQPRKTSIKDLWGVYMTQRWTNAGNEAKFTPTNRCFASDTGGTRPSWPWFRGAQLTLIRERGIEGEGEKKEDFSQKGKKVSLKKKQGGILVVHIHIWSNCKRVCQCRPIGWPMNESGITPTKIPNHLSSVSRKWKNIVWTKENQLKRLNLFFPEGHPVQCATFRYYIYF